MREIKFRGKRVSDGKWIYGDYTDQRFDEPSIWDDGYRVEVDNNTVGQYTGLKDKMLNDIYDGDIVEYNFNNSVLDTKERIIVSKVYMHELRNCYAVNAGDYMNNDLWRYTNQGINSVKVIGNIHDNPELLK